MRKSLAAVLEVTAVTAFALVAYKALKLVEPSGLNCAPGLVMIAATAVALALVRPSERPRYGVLVPSWRAGFSFGALAGAAILPVWWIEVRASRAVSLLPSATPALSLLVLAAALAFSRRRFDERAEKATGQTWAALLVAGVLAAVAATGLASGVPPSSVLATIAWRFLFTGFGEELFFRGYIQSRLNVAIGRPFRWLGADMGPGLFVSAFLFGVVHLFNPMLLFHGRWEVSWSWGASAFLSGLVYGYCREKSGSVWAGAVLHGIAGAYSGVISAIQSA